MLLVQIKILEYAQCQARGTCLAMKTEIIEVLSIIKGYRLKLLRETIYDFKGQKYLVKLSVVSSSFCQAYFLFSICKPLDLKVIE